MRRTLEAIDGLIFKVEQALIVACLALMSLTVFMDVLHRRLSDPHSKLASLLLRLSGAAAESGLGSFTTEIATPATTLLVCFGLVFLVVRRLPSLADSALLLWLSATSLATATLYGFAWMVVALPSRWAYASLLLVAAAATLWLGRSQQAELRRRVYLGLLVGAGLSIYGLANMPAGYSWAQNFSLFLLLWVGFMGASVATRQRRHIQVDAFRKLVPASWLPSYNALSLLISALFSLFLLIIGTLYTFGPEGNVHLAADLGRVPDWLVTASIPVTFAVITARFIAQTGQELMALASGEASPTGRREGAGH